MPTPYTEWKDLGAIGIDLTNVTALASKTGHIYIATGWTAGASPEVYRYNVTTGVSELVSSNAGFTTYDSATCIYEDTNGKEYIFVAGGHNGDGTYLTNVSLFDVALKTNTATTSMPTGREDATATYINGKIYVVGGSNGAYLTKVEVFDVATKTWSNAPSTIYTHSAHSAVAYEGKLYIIGGRGTGAGKLEVYDPATEIWTAKTGMVSAGFPSVWHHGADVKNGFIYVVGGETDNDQYNDSSIQTYIYDITANTWALGAPMPKDCDRHGFAFSKTKGKGYVFGGWDNNSIFQDNVFELSTARITPTNFNEEFGDFDNPLIVDFIGDDWTIKTVSRDGEPWNCLTSPDITNGQTTSVEFFLDAGTLGTGLLLDYRVSSELKDYFRVYIDGVQALQDSGTTGGFEGWYTTQITPGIHRIKLSFEKDASGTSGYDCVYIDSILSMS